MRNQTKRNKVSFYYIVERVSYGELVYFPFFSLREVELFIEEKEGKLVKPNTSGVYEYKHGDNELYEYCDYEVFKWRGGDDIVEGGYVE